MIELCSTGSNTISTILSISATLSEENTIKMALSFSVLIALFGVFVSQVGSTNSITTLLRVFLSLQPSVNFLQNEAQLQLPYDPTIYQNLFKGAPYYSFCDLPWLTFFDQSYFVNFNDLANQFNIRVSDLYQMHSIIESNMPTIPYQNEYNILYTAATEVKKEMDRRGLYYLPTPPACYPLSQYPESPLPPVCNYDVFLTMLYRLIFI